MLENLFVQTTLSASSHPGYYSIAIIAVVTATMFTKVSTLH